MTTKEMTTKAEETPLTDAVLASQPNNGFGLDKGQCIMQWYDHARTLERELTAERAKNARIVADRDNAWEQFRRMRNLLAEAKYGDRLQKAVAENARSQA